MRSVSTGRLPAMLAVAKSRLLKTGLLALALLMGLGLSACTTTEGTNAMGDFGTFEREVMTETLIGLGGMPRTEKEEPKMARAPLVMPKDTKRLPAPTTSLASQLPEDSDKVQIDATGLSDADLSRLRNAKVVDLRTLSGRPLTDVEAKQLTARMTAAQRKDNSARPLYLPPDEYFTTVGGTDLICLAKSGDLVPLESKECPAEIRDALRNRGIKAAPGDKGGADVRLATGGKSS